MMWLLSLPMLTRRRAIRADMTIQLHGPTFLKATPWRPYSDREWFRLSLGPPGSELVVFVGTDEQVTGALLAGGFSFDKLS